MSSHNRDIVNEVYSALVSDANLAQHVRSFSKGDMRSSRPLFPFVSVGNVSYAIEQYSVAGEMHEYSIDLLCGTSSLVPGLSFSGDGNGKPGIVQLCDDVASALRGSRLNGALLKPIREITVRTGVETDAAGDVMLGAISFRCQRLISR